MNHVIEIVVSPTGETRLETKGFAGGSCQHASRDLERALGNKLAEQLTAEFYQEQEATTHHLQQGGSA
jgi:hypothetical protein